MREAEKGLQQCMCARMHAAAADEHVKGGSLILYGAKAARLVFRGTSGGGSSFPAFHADGFVSTWERACAHACSSPNGLHLIRVACGLQWQSLALADEAHVRGTRAWHTTGVESALGHGRQQGGRQWACSCRW